MSSELKLTGASGGNIILQGDDVITSDQTFTFPNTGGEVVTAPTGGSVVGYQQGTFLPDIKTTNELSVWMRDGVSVGTNIAAGASFEWWRNGQTVTINIFFKVGSAGNGADVQTLIVTNLPYKAKDAPVATGGPFYFGTAISATLFQSDTAYATVVPFIQSVAGDSTEIKGGYAFYFILSAPIASANTALKGKDIANNGSMYARLTYQTDDTTWTPQNGATLS